MYHNSIFNFKYKRAENENVVYNTFSKALLVLTDEELDILESDSYEGTYLFDDFREHDIVVDGDELLFLKYIHYRSKFNNNTLVLTIAPTMDCNFACPYCYENRRKGVMSDEVQKGVLDYIRESVEGGIRAVNLTWYGGEPLLYFDIVRYMSQEITEICQDNKCRLKMDIVSNGYLLTEEIVEELENLGFFKIQITIDGMKDNHNVRRPLRGGGGTFDKIVENLSLFDDSSMSVLIRMNTDNTNCVDFVELKALIDSLGNENIRLYASPVEDLNKDTVNEVSDFMSSQDFEAFALESCENGSWSDDDFSVMDDRFCFCTSETENCYVIDDVGNFYKCWDEVGREEYACFNIRNREERNDEQIAKFVAVDPFSDEKCKKCVFLPLCFGGCKFQRAHLNKSVCGFTDESLKTYLEVSFFKE